VKGFAKLTFLAHEIESKVLIKILHACATSVESLRIIFQADGGVFEVFNPISTKALSVVTFHVSSLPFVPEAGTHRRDL